MLKRGGDAMTTDKEPLAQRLWSDMAAALAMRLDVCPRHGTRLICAWCDLEWTGTAAEEVEADHILAKVEVTLVEWPCRRCSARDRAIQKTALCLDCQEEVRDQPFDGLTPEEEARLHALLRTCLRFTCMPDPDAADTGQQSHGGERTP
jgi:hypothetical protein